MMPSRQVVASVAVAAFNTHSNVRNKHEERRDEAIKD
jgi:hypothetical protein